MQEEVRSVVPRTSTRKLSRESEEGDEASNYTQAGASREGDRGDGRIDERGNDQSIAINHHQLLLNR
jgi:hypothetical protein